MLERNRKLLEASLQNLHKTRENVNHTAVVARPHIYREPTPEKVPEKAPEKSHGDNMSKISFKKWMNQWMKKWWQNRQ